MSTIDKSKMDRYINGVKVKDGKKDEDSFTGKQYWWRASKENMGREIQGTIRFIQTHQSTRLEQLTASTRLYGNSSAFNFIGPALSRSASSSANSQSNRISFNLCAAVVDTIVAKTAKNKVVPNFITSGGVWEMQNKGEELNKFLEGCFHAHDVEMRKSLMVKDGGVWGTGVVKIFEEDDDICVDRRFPHNILVDEFEAISGKPRQMHEFRMVDRDVLLSIFKDDEEACEAISAASPTNYIDMGGMATAADILTVTESWHLKSGREETDGMHAICLGDQVLFSEQYDKDYFPFVFFRYSERQLGFWGQGACERLQNLQGEVNRLMILDQKSRWMMASFKILVENGSKVVSQHLNNDVGTIIHYTGTPPQYVTPPAIDGSNGEKINDLIAKGFQQEGVSQLAASSMKPSGVDSGAALRQYDDIGDDRLLFLSQEVERCVLEMGRQMIEVAKDIYSRKKTFKVIFPTDKFMETIDWKDVKLKADEYVLKAYPVNTLSDDPTGRLSQIQEEMQAGIISPRQGRRLMSRPDVEMADKLANAAEDLLSKIIEDILCKGEYQPPEPFYDLTLAKTLSLEYYNYAVLHNCPEERLELLRRFMSQVDDLTGVNQVAAPAAGPMAGPGAPPMGPSPGLPLAAPEPQQTSNLIQNTGGAA